MNGPRHPTYTSIFSAASVPEVAGTKTLSVSLGIFIIPREFISVVVGIMLVTATGRVINRSLGAPVSL